ncbi:MAG: hypothetical protein Q4E46_02705 [Candidatus Saccharibacteria bacterium]|nr:hypothetical protein [Candidatus Saccharibacteria bacterium]
MASTLEEVFKVSLHLSDRPIEEEYPDAFEVVTFGALREYYPQARIRDCFAMDSQPYAQMTAKAWKGKNATPERVIFELFPSNITLCDIEYGRRLILPFEGAKYGYDVTIFDFEPPLIQVARDLRQYVFGTTLPHGGIIPGELTLTDNPICFNQLLDVGNAKSILVYGKSITGEQLRNLREFTKERELLSLRILELDTDAVIIPMDLAAILLGISETSLRYDLAAALRATAMRIHEHVNRYAAHI